MKMFTMRLTIEQSVKTIETNKDTQKLQNKSNDPTFKSENLICLLQFRIWKL